MTSIIPIQDHMTYQRQTQFPQTHPLKHLKNAIRHEDVKWSHLENNQIIKGMARGVLCAASAMLKRIDPRELPDHHQVCKSEHFGNV
jgi:hypothetical protein